MIEIQATKGKGRQKDKMDFLPVKNFCALSDASINHRVGENAKSHIRYGINIQNTQRTPKRQQRIWAPSSEGKTSRGFPPSPSLSQKCRHSSWKRSVYLPSTKHHDRLILFSPLGIKENRSCLQALGIITQLQGGKKKKEQETNREPTCFCSPPTIPIPASKNAVTAEFHPETTGENHPPQRPSQNLLFSVEAL